MALTSPQAFRSIPQDYQGAQWTRNIKSVRHQAQAPTQGSTRQDFGCLSGACSYKRGGRAQRLWNISTQNDSTRQSIEIRPNYNRRYFTMHPLNNPDIARLGNTESEQQWYHINTVGQDEADGETVHSGAAVKSKWTVSSGRSEPKLNSTPPPKYKPNLNHKTASCKMLSYVLLGGGRVVPGELNIAFSGTTGASLSVFCIRLTQQTRPQRTSGQTLLGNLDSDPDLREVGLERRADGWPLKRGTYTAGGLVLIKCSSKS
ncbi:hypothetical protein B0H19DRAFT_1241193 [Mycena capillaripes]|nr:hypothetical protein B0H19DRAFT_1241193 [Mycena capillaripes]